VKGGSIADQPQDVRERVLELLRSGVYDIADALIAEHGLSVAKMYATAFPNLVKETNHGHEN
jgi:uncharacterized protein YutE (UPF0331/DUF86 family)